ncbi:hypothetical protein Tcan_13991, partial [Toxocara canis]
SRVHPETTASLNASRTPHKPPSLSTTQLFTEGTTKPNRCHQLGRSFCSSQVANGQPSDGRRLNLNSLLGTQQPNRSPSFIAHLLNVGTGSLYAPMRLSA